MFNGFCFILINAVTRPAVHNRSSVLRQCTRSDATLDDDVGNDEVEDGKFEEHVVRFVQHA